MEVKQWNNIKSEEDFRTVMEKSQDFPQIIFKDSVSCGISAYAKQRITEGFDHLVNKADFNYLDLLSYRSISNLIADELKVIHQSPQIIVVKDGVATYSSTHHNIEPKTIAKKL